MLRVLLALALFLLPLAAPARGGDTLRIVFFDVGQGDAILVDDGETELLIDGGPSGTWIPELVPYVDGLLDMVMLTHPHADHMGGLDDVIRQFAVGQYITNGATAGTSAYANLSAAVAAARLRPCVVKRNTPLTLGDLGLRILHPAELTGSANNDSIVLEVAWQTFRFLFTGDISSGTEKALAQAHCLSAVSVLKVAHHASQYSTSADFLTATSPLVAVYSAGVGNRYGHPAPSALARLQAADCTILGTDVLGTIVITARDGELFYATATSAGVLHSTTLTSPTEGPCPLLLTQVEVNPFGPDSGHEWIEVQNVAGQYQNLAGWAVTYTGYGGGAHAVPAIALPPGASLRITLPKQWLENSRGDPIRLLDPSGRVADTTPSLKDTYNDQQIWYRVCIAGDWSAEWLFGDPPHREGPEA